MSKKDDNSKFRLYLKFNFEERVDLSEVKNWIEKEAPIQWIEYGLAGMTGNHGFFIKTTDIEMETVDIEDVTKIFLARHNKELDNFNKIAKKFEGFFVMEVVVKINKKQMPAIYFESDFLAFIKGLNKLANVDVDMYHL